MARLGRRLRDSVSVTYLSTLPSTSPTSSYHPNHSDSTITILIKPMRCVKIQKF